jgi:hypothetical protein
MHWQRWHRHGNPDTVLPPSAGPQDPPEVRFWAKVDQSDPDGCWLWTAARDRDGYGHFKFEGRMWRAPRWIFNHTNPTPLADDEMVRHTCDNPPCVRPDHLVRGDVVANMADQLGRDRNAHGDRHGARLHPETVRRGTRNAAARLTDENVIDIRRRYAAGETQMTLASAFAVSQPLISQIVRRKVWTHLEE